MPVSKLRCRVCRDYYPRDIMVKIPLGHACPDHANPAALNPIESTKVIPGKTDKKPRLSGNLRRKVRDRDGGNCRWCGRRTARMEIHHILYRSQGGPDHVGNLILLCQEHHTQAHSNKRLWQPVLLAVIWANYAEGRFYLVPQMVSRLKQEKLLPCGIPRSQCK